MDIIKHFIYCPFLSAILKNQKYLLKNKILFYFLSFFYFKFSNSWLATLPMKIGIQHCNPMLLRSLCNHLEHLKYHHSIDFQDLQLRLHTRYECWVQPCKHCPSRKHPEHQGNLKIYDVVLWEDWFQIQQQNFFHYFQEHNLSVQGHSP